MFGPCALPPHPSVYACPSAGDALSSSRHPRAWLHSERLRLPVLCAKLGPRDVAGRELVWAAGFLLPRGLGDTVPVRFWLFPVGAGDTMYILVVQKDCLAKPASFIYSCGWSLYLENNLQNICVQGCIYSCYRQQL